MGSNAIFTATATPTSGETITGYAWLKSTNSQGPFSAVSGATSAVLAIMNAQSGDTGFYFVRVSYQSGGNPGVAVSTVVTLTVRDQARITSEPQSLTQAAGTTASFTVTAAGQSPLAYQWRFNGASLTNGGRIAGATGLNLTVSTLAAPDSGNYDVIVSNSFGAVTSQVATLTVLVPPSVSTQPGNITALTGSTVSLSATVNGTTPLTYRWRKGGVNVSNGGRISGATNTTLVITGALTNDTGIYSLFITNSIGSTSSIGATVTVLAPPVITSATNKTGRQGLAFTFVVTATGSSPITFGAGALPTGLSIMPSNGVISGIPAVTGVFDVAVFAGNPATTTTGRVVITLTTGVPGITSPLTVQAKQGESFTYTIVASNNPVAFTASDLPSGLGFDAVNGIISGTPLVSGIFPITIGVTNLYGSDSKELTLELTTGAPGITSPLDFNGKQGQFLIYTIVASNNPVSFSASGLPGGLSLDPTTGVISGIPIESGPVPVSISAENPFGSDTQVLIFNLATAAPVITSALTTSWTENQTNFTYTIRASNSPVSFDAQGLPLGLTVNTNTGLISGTPAYGGTNNVIISARNAWGNGSNTWRLIVGYSPITNLFITDVTWTYSKPYLLDFSFSLRDSLDPVEGRSVVRLPSELQVIPLEGNLRQQVAVPIGNETTSILSRGITSNAKQLKTFLTLDYSYSMFIAQAIGPMQAAVEGLINQEPGTAQFAVNEFHADNAPPALVRDFTSDKVLLTNAIEGIQTNFVKGNYAGSRLYDALNAAILKFGAPNPDEQRYLIVTTDGYDDSSVLSPGTPGQIISLATNARVQIYCVGFGSNPNTNVLQQLSSRTGGRYFSATNASDIGAQFTLLLKDLSAQYLLRWATLQRGVAFQPMFTVAVDGFVAPYNTNFPVTVIDSTAMTTNIYKIDNYTTPPTTNDPAALAPDFAPSAWGTNVLQGELRLVADAVSNISFVTLRAFYAPRYVREIRVHYRSNYPCTPILLSNGPGDVLRGWSLTQMDDGTNGQWLSITSPDPQSLLTSLPYGVRTDLVQFQFQHRAVPATNQAFSLFTVDNSIYTNMPPVGQSFTLATNSFITVYPVAPPHGTPVPWLYAHGFSNNLAVAEESDPNGNGLQVWQDYVAGLDPNDTNAVFIIRVFVAAQPAQPNVITFSTTTNRTYRVEWATTLGIWLTLQDGIVGTEGDVTVTDARNLSTVDAIFYRIGVY